MSNAGDHTPLRGDGKVLTRCADCPEPIVRYEKRGMLASITVGDWLKLGVMVFTVILWALQVRNDMNQVRSDLAESRLIISEMRLEVQALKLEQARVAVLLEFLVDREKSRGGIIAPSNPHSSMGVEPAMSSAAERIRKDRENRENRERVGG